jgi:hypothetical protein
VKRGELTRGRAALAAKPRAGFRSLRDL